MKLYNHSFTIQKIARDVTMAMNSGKDPLQELIKQAQRENLTPSIVKDAVHYINNEIFLNHFEKKANGSPKILKPEDVLAALGIKDIEKKASDPVTYEDYWDLGNKPTIFDKLADYEGCETYENIKKSQDTRKKWEKIAETRHNEATTHAKIVKNLAKLASLKEKLYNDALLALNQETIVPEELLIYTKQANSTDVHDTIARAFTDSKVTDLQMDAYEKIAETPENYVIVKNHILNTIDSICAQRNELDKVADEYKVAFCNNDVEEYQRQMANFMYKLYRVKIHGYFNK